MFIDRLTLDNVNINIDTRQKFHGHDAISERTHEQRINQL